MAWQAASPWSNLRRPPEVQQQRWRQRTKDVWEEPPKGNEQTPSEPTKTLLEDKYQRSIPDHVDFVKIHARRKEISLELHGRELGDHGLRNVLTPGLRLYLWAQLGALQPQASWHYINVNLSGNNLTPKGVAVLVEFVRECRQHSTPVYVRVLKLFRNQLGDDGVLWVAHLVLTQPQPFHEIHLSHNRITAAGAVTLVLSFGLFHPWAVYPFRTTSTADRFIPCWFRLEANDIADPAGIINHFEHSAEARVLMCAADETQFGPLRSPGRCITAEATPHVVLHMFEKQHTANLQRDVSRARTRHDIEQLILFAREKVWTLVADTTVAAWSADVLSDTTGSPMSSWATDTTSDAHSCAWSAEAGWNASWRECWELDAQPFWSADGTILTNSPASLNWASGPSSAVTTPIKDVTEFACSLPAGVPPLPAQAPLPKEAAMGSPRSTLLMMTGAWGALCSDGATLGALHPSPSVPRHSFLHYRAAMRSVSPPQWQCEGRLIAAGPDPCESLQEVVAKDDKEPVRRGRWNHS